MDEGQHAVDHSAGASARLTRDARRAVLAGAVGTTIELYDFFIYGTASALVLNRLFFPSHDPAVGTLAAFATLFVGFAVRPIGSTIFGHIGDKLGRKRALIITLLLMGAVTGVMGLLPTYGQIGIWAPIILVTLRCIQGLAYGGEWGGAAVLASEHANRDGRGFAGSLVQLGSPIGLLLSSGAFALVALLPDDQLLSWGWRIPFLASAILVGIGLWVRLGIKESPEFVRAKEAGEMSSRVPAIDVFRHSWRELVIAVFLRFGPDIGYFVFGTFVVSYAVNAGVPRPQILLGVVVAASIEVVTMPLFGRLSDRIGRRRQYLIGSAWWAAIAFPAFWLIDTGSTGLAWVALVLAFAVGHAMLWSIAPAINSELFPTRYRLTGVSYGLSLSAIFAGGPAPLIAASLVLALGGASWGVSLYVVAAAAVSFVAILCTPETSKRQLSDDFTRQHKPAHPAEEIAAD